MVRLFFVVLASIALIGCTAGTAPDKASSAGSESAVAATPTSGDVKEVTLRVPTMECPVACWPKVKEILEKQPGVAEVVLAEQKAKDTIDNPLVTVKLAGQFDSAKAIESLAVAKFENATVEN
jgi:copper chaperone CopZ